MDLTAAFEELKLPKGDPDLNRRRFFLNEIFPLLVTSEIFQIQEILNDMRLKLPGNGILRSLPTEAYFRIMDDLYLEDLLRLRLVCQSWATVFCSVDVCTHVIKKYFSLPVDYYYAKSGLVWSDLEEIKKKDWLRRFIINRIRRERGITSKSFELNYNHDSNISLFDFRYSNGRVATLDRLHITVEDLITRHRSTFSLPQNVTHKDWQLSDQFLIVSYENSHELVAWNLISGRKYSAQLFDEVCSISASQTQVGIITSLGLDETKSFNLCTWDLTNAVKLVMKLKIDSNIEIADFVAANIFFHVSNKDVLFVVHQTQIENYGKQYTRVTVQCFEAGKLVSTQNQIMHSYSRPGGYRNLLITNDGIICCEIWEHPSFRSKDHPYLHHTYDMNRRVFLCLETQIQPKNKRNFYSYRNHIWRDQLYNTVRVDEEVKLQVITLSKCLSDIWYGLMSSNDCLSQNSLRSSLLSGENRSHCDSIEYPIDLKYPTGNLEVAWGDDSYLILQLGKTLKVWQFDSLGLEPSRSL